MGLEIIGEGYTCWSPRLLLLSPRHSDRQVPRCFSCRNYKRIKSISSEKSSRYSGQVCFLFFFLFLKVGMSSSQTAWPSLDLIGENLQEIRPAPDTFVPIKDHLPSLLPGWKKSSKEKHLENQVFSSLPPAKESLISRAVWRGGILCFVFYAHQKLGKVNQIWR